MLQAWLQLAVSEHQSAIQVKKSEELYSC